ncbi:MAG TPA: transporter [Stellaceae bacterium]|nr:transporter [Stellaceae bacterium]
MLAQHASAGVNLPSAASGRLGLWRWGTVLPLPSSKRMPTFSCGQAIRSAIGLGALVLRGVGIAAAEKLGALCSSGRVRSHLHSGSIAVAIAAIFILCSAGGALAQDMEPRAYSAVPIDTNFLILGYRRITGAVSLNTALPVSNVRASINAGIVGYDRTFDLFGQAASAAIVIPYLRGTISGDVGGEGNKVARKGLGDIALRITQNLIGNPAQTPVEFLRRAPTTTLGVGLTALLPTGDYNSQHLINISTHRWTFYPEIGLSQPIGNWFVDGIAGVFVFTNNTDFFGGHVRGEDPLWVFQAHAGYNFGSDFWLAVDAMHYFGGTASLDGVSANNFQSVTRYGLTLSVPLGGGFSEKVSGGSWLTSRNGGAFDQISLTLQYRWFDP